MKYLFGLLALGLSVLVSLVAAGDDDQHGPWCPEGFKLELQTHGNHQQCVCVSDKGKTCDFNDHWTASVKSYVWPKHGQYCFPKYTPPPPPPTPSKGFHWKEKKSLPQSLLPDGTVSPCPEGTYSCPIMSPHISDNIYASIECIEPSEDLRNCGGCSALGEGQNCMAIDGVRSTACVFGQCEVYTCRSGYRFTVQDKAVVCLPDGPTHTN